MVAGRGSQVDRGVVPRPSADCAVFGFFGVLWIDVFPAGVEVLGVPVAASFPDVTVHVVQAPGVGLLQPTLTRECLGLLVIDHVFAPPAVIADLLRVVAITERRLATGAAGLFLTTCRVVAASED